MSTLHQPNIIKDVTFDFAVRILKYSEKLELERRFVVARQLMKSGTSVGANVREAQHAESRADFIHKMKVAAKEAEETEYWLLLCNAAGYPATDDLLSLCQDVKRILARIIFSAKSVKKVVGG
jgi:four helix bundle protein